MRLSIDRNALLRSMTAVGRVVEKKNTAPIIGNVVLDATGADTLRLAGTDLDLTIGDLVPAIIDTSGATTVPAHLLTDILKKSPAGSTISMSLSDDRGTLVVQSGRSKFRLQCLPVEDFPEFAPKKPSHTFELPGRTFRQLFERTSFAMSTEETRYYLNGVYLHAYGEDACLRGVATDGHRLARTQIPMPAGADGVWGMIVPRKSVGELLRLLDTADDAYVEISDTYIRVTVGTVTMTSKLIDGTFPDYARVIPAKQGLPTTVKLKSRQMQSAVERILAIAAAKGRGMSIEMRDGLATLSMRSPENGEATDEVDISLDGAETVGVGFNANYLCGLLDHQIGDETTMHLGVSGSPVVFESVGDQSSLYVLMPMNVSP